MRKLWVIALFVSLASSISGEQQISPFPPTLATDVQPAPVKAYAVDPGVMAPELLPLNQPPFPTEKCKKKADGRVVFSLLVDSAGLPHNIMPLIPFSAALDKLALKIVEADRFKPGVHDGAPVEVSESVEVEIQSCIVEAVDNDGKKPYSLRLRSMPVQKLGVVPQPVDEAIHTADNQKMEDVVYSAKDGISASVVLYEPAAELSDEAWRAKYQGVCVVSMIVDAKGIPQNVHVLRSLGMGLDEKAIEAARKYRFKPAMKKDGTPVPVMLKVEINFSQYAK